MKARVTRALMDVALENLLLYTIVELRYSEFYFARI